MNRRTVLVAGGLILTTSLGGCLSDEAEGEHGSENADDQEGESGHPEGNDGDNREVIEENPRIDDPPYDIERPDPPDDPADFDQWNDEYLGAQMETEPSLAFRTIPVSAGWVRDTGLGGMERSSGEAYQVRVVAGEDDYERLFRGEEMEETVRDRLNAVDFDESVLVVVESGFGSGSVEHRWARIECEEGIVHLHGYYTDPYEQTDDIDTRFSVLEVERPSAGPDFARVSLTVDEHRRVHFNSTEGVVALDTDSFESADGDH